MQSHPSGRSPIVRAAIFDMDGLMLDTERMAGMAWQRAMADWGYSFSEPVFLETVGRTHQDTEAIFRAAFGVDFPLGEISQRRRQYYLDHMANRGIPLKAGLLDLLDCLDQLGLPKAVASSTERALVLRKLGIAGLAGRFDAMVGGDEVIQGKPAPDIFLVAARRMQVAPDHCLVLEDSEAGIQAAHAAGMWPVMVPDLVQPSPETAGLAYAILPSLHEVRALFGAQSADTEK